MYRVITIMFTYMYVHKNSTYTKFRRVVIATKKNHAKNLTGEVFYLQKFPDLWYVHIHLIKTC